MAPGHPHCGFNCWPFVLRQKQQNQYDFLTARAWHAERIVQEAPKVWEELRQNPNTENTLTILKERFFLPALVAIRIGRLLDIFGTSLR